MAQGKKWKKKKIIELLRPFFLLGYSVKGACECAGVKQSTVATWLLQDEELRLKIKIWQNDVNASARKNLKTAVKKGDAYWSAHWLDRKDREFTPKEKVIDADDDKEEGNELLDQYDSVSDDAVDEFIRAQQRAAKRKKPV